VKVQDKGDGVVDDVADGFAFVYRHGDNLQLVMCFVPSQSQLITNYIIRWHHSSYR
jgi:hypothetical protein